MSSTIHGLFATRREAELAVEHLVQDHGRDRADVFVAPEGSRNSAGTEAFGGDVESHPQNTDNANEPALNGRIEVSVDVNDDDQDAIEQIMREAGAEDVRRD